MVSACTINSRNIFGDIELHLPLWQTTAVRGITTRAVDAIGHVRTPTTLKRKDEADAGDVSENLRAETERATPRILPGTIIGMRGAESCLTNGVDREVLVSRVHEAIVATRQNTDTERHERIETAVQGPREGIQRKFPA
jgi:hypothetical protein